MHTRKSGVDRCTRAVIDPIDETRHLRIYIRLLTDALKRAAIDEPCDAAEVVRELREALHLRRVDSRCDLTRCNVPRLIATAKRLLGYTDGRAI